MVDISAEIDELAKACSECSDCPVAIRLAALLAKLEKQLNDQSTA